MNRNRKLDITLEPRTHYAYVVAVVTGPTRTVEAKMGIDTGMARTCLDRRIADVLGIDPSAFVKETLSAVGGPADAARARLDRVSILDRELENVNVLFAEFSHCDGLLGNDWLDRFNLLAVIDVRKRYAPLVLRS